MPDTRAIRLIPVVALALTLPALCTGCWFVAGGAVAAGGGGGGGGGDVVVNAAPSLTSEDPGRLTADQVDLEVVVFDTNNQDVSVTATLIKAPAQAEVPLSLVSAVVVDSGAPLTVGAPEAGNVVSGIPATAAGTRIRITWQASADQDLQQALLNPTLVYVVSDGQAQSAPVQETGDGFVLGNDAPDTSAVSLQGTTGNVTVIFTVSDSTADPVNATVEFSTDDFGADIRSATIVVGGLTDLAAPTGGQQHTVSWDTVTDLGILDVTVSVRVRTDDSLGGLDTDTAAVVDIDNDTAPVASILSVGTVDGFAAVDGRIPIRFALFDEEADLDPTGASGRPNVRIEVTAEPGQLGFPATGLPRLRNQGRDLSVLSLNGLRARPGPNVVEDGDSNVHTFLWDALADGIGGVGTLNVAIKVIPIANGVAGQADTDTRFLGDGAPRFGDEELFSIVSQRPEQLAVADLDLDGFQDVVAAGNGFQSDTIVVFFGDGNGGVDATLSLTGSSSNQNSLEIADVNGDGALDLVYSSGAGLLCVRLNAGGRTFGAETSTASANAGRNLVLADIDKDGDLDAVVPSAQTNEVLVHAGNGTAGSFAAGTAFGVGAVPLQVAVGDINGDGNLDIVTANNGDSSASVLLGDGTVTGFSVQPTPIATSDQPVDPSLVDIDEDGKLDLVVVTNFGNAVNIRIGEGDGTFGDQVNLTAGIVPKEANVRDINGDGHLDLLTLAPTSQDVRIRLGDGKGNFGSEASFGFSARPEKFILADLDGDGQLDLLLGTEEGVRMRRGTGGGGASAEVAIPTVSPGAGLADLDGDGVLDLAVAQALDQRLDIFLGEGGASFADALGPPLITGIFPLAVGLADLDRDGDLDVVVKEGATATVALAQGGGIFNISTNIVLAAENDNLTRVGLGDINDDGLVDAVIHTADDTVTPFFGNGAGDFTQQPPLVIGNGADHVLVVDVDADGIGDVVVGTRDPGQVTIRFGPNLAAVDEKILPCTDAAKDVAVLDFDGDGRLDIAVAGKSPDSVSIYLATGVRLFTGEIRVASAIGPTNISAADTDGDGRLDLVVGSEQTPSFLLVRPRPASGVSLSSVPGFGRGNGHAAGLILSKLTVPTSTTSFAAVVGETSDDGVDDVALLGGSGTQVQVSAASVASVEVPQVFLTAEGVTGRLLPTEPFNLRREPPAPAGSGSTIRLAEASIAMALIPDSATIDTATLTLPLHAFLTNEELNQGLVRVFRNDQSLTPRIDLILGTKFFDNFVEVARRDPNGAGFPAGVGIATVDATAGTISFDIARTGRYQVFLEIDETAGAEAVLFRETFDTPKPDGDGDAPLPLGWFGSPVWVAGVAGGPNRPAPASSPNLFGLGLDFDYADGAGTDTMTSTEFSISDPLTRTVKLRTQVWHDLGAGESVEVVLNLRNLVDDTRSQQVLKTFTGLRSAAVALTLDEVDITAAVTEGLTGGTGVGADPNRGAVCSLDFILRSDGDGNVGRGFFVDDVEIVLSP